MVDQLAADAPVLASILDELGVDVYAWRVTCSVQGFFPVLLRSGWSSLWIGR
jgi:hypothetical protein